jgi:hypothetical protein
MNRGLVIEAGVVDRLSWNVSAQDSWLESASAGDPVDGVVQVEHAGFLYLFGHEADSDSRLLVIAADDGRPFFQLAARERLECFQRIIKVSLSRFGAGAVRVPIDWRLFHSGSLLSFQSNRLSSHVRSRVYVDLSPEATDHAYVFALVDDEKAPLTRVGYSPELFADAVLNFEGALGKAPKAVEAINGGQLSVALTRSFSAADVSQGIPFTTWRDSKLTSDQLEFFNAPFDGPLRLRGAAGTGKTLVLCLRFLREVYDRLDAGVAFRAAFVAHGQETADLIRLYLTHIDERGVLPQLHADGVVEVATLHSLANDFVNFDAEGVLPISLDGAEGRTLQMELMRSIAEEMKQENGNLSAGESSLLESFLSDPASPQYVGFLCDLIDEFASVLESYGVRDVDLIAERYLRTVSGGRVLAKSAEEKWLVLELYRRFRRQLAEMNVVSLDQFIADFIAYLNSFRWDAVRARRGFDFVFADELHLFNRQERQVFAYLMRDASMPMRVALAYDPRQSPRSSFLPLDPNKKDSVWIEAKLASGGQKFELSDVFRYTPQVLKFLQRLNRHFPADDLSEEWGLVFGSSMKAAGEVPAACSFKSRLLMAGAAADSAKRVQRRSSGRAAVLCLDPDRFPDYVKAGIFGAFVAVTSRDELSAIQRFSQRAVLSMPELVAGLQFDHVFLLDANAALVTKLGGAVNGLQRFVSATYLGASRASETLTLFADESEGGFAQPIRDAIDCGFLRRLT